MSLVPKNWATFQHYKDRSPAWIKLHRGLLDDYEFNCLPLASRALAPMLWLIASEYERGEITASPQALAFRLRTSEQDFIAAVKPLIDGGLFIDASGALAERKQVAIPEEKEEKEIQDKTEKNIRAVAPATRPSVGKDFDEFWKAYPKRDGANPKAPARKTFLAAVKAGHDPQTIIAGARRYGAECRSKSIFGTSYVAQAKTWMHQARWEDYPEAIPETNVIELPGHYAAFDSPELDAWAAHERAIGKSFPRDKAGGWRFPTQWPPSYQSKSA